MLYDIIILESYLYHIYNYNICDQSVTAIILCNYCNYYCYELKILKKEPCIEIIQENLIEFLVQNYLLYIY